MGSSGIILQIVFALVRLIPFVLILIASIILLQKTKYTSTLLMVIGQAVIGIPSLFSIVQPFLLQNEMLPMRSIGTIFGVISAISLIGAILFGVGLLLLAKDIIKSREISSI